jgi:hypothetical protein
MHLLYIITFAEPCFRFPHGFLHWGAGPGFEPVSAVQQADALLSELRHTLSKLRRTLT